MVCGDVVCLYERARLRDRLNGRREHEVRGDLHQIGVDAVITSRSQLVAAGRAEGLVTIQRLLLVDDSALETGVRTIARAAPDFIEVLPGIIFPDVASILQQLLPGPFIAGGFIRDSTEVVRIQSAGAVLSSSSSYKLWYNTSR